MKQPQERLEQNQPQTFSSPFYRDRVLSSHILWTPVYNDQCVYVCGRIIRSWLITQQEGGRPTQRRTMFFSLSLSLFAISPPSSGGGARLNLLSRAGFGRTFPSSNSLETLRSQNIGVDHSSSHGEGKSIVTRSGQWLNQTATERPQKLSGNIGKGGSFATRTVS